MSLSGCCRFRLAMLLVGAIVSTCAADAAEIDWREDIDVALQDANRAGKPVLIQFTAPWCGYCHKMFKTTFREDEIVSLVGERMIALRIDADKQAELAEQVGVAGLPTTLIVAPDLRILKKLTGFQTANKIRRHLDAACHVAKSDVPTVPVTQAMEQTAVTAAPAPTAGPDAAGAVPAFGHCCLVSLREHRAIVKGVPQYSVEYRGSRLVFASDELRRKFLADPSHFWPVLDGHCAVNLVDEERAAIGAPEFGAIYRNRVWFFDSASAMREFVDEPSDYASAVQ